MARTPRQGPAAPRTKQANAKGEVTHVRYSREKADDICERIAKGQIWSQICNTDGLPAYTTLYAWLRRYPDFAEAYAQAREVAADLRADEALLVAQNATPATVTADRLKVSTLQWMAARHSPGRYGGRAGAKPDPEEVVVTIKPRQFERAVRPDGTVYVRDVTPDAGDRD